MGKTKPKGKSMQGYFILADNASEFVSAVCKNCVDTDNFSLRYRTSVFVGEDFNGTIPCLQCEEVIDGVEVEPKPESWTVTVELVVYSVPEEIEATEDVEGFVRDILDTYFDGVEVTDVKEHF